MRLFDRYAWLMLDDFAVRRSGYLLPLLLPNRRLIRARGTVYCPCQEIPREPFEPFGTSSLNSNRCPLAKLAIDFAFSHTPHVLCQGMSWESYAKVIKKSGS